MKKVCLFLVVGLLFSCGDSNDIERRKLFVLKNEIMKNNDDIINCMSEKNIMIDTITKNGNLSEERIFFVNQKISNEMDSLLNITYDLHKKLNKMDFESQEHFILQDVILRLETSSQCFL